MWWFGAQLVGREPGRATLAAQGGQGSAVWRRAQDSLKAALFNAALFFFAFCIFFFFFRSSVKAKWHNVNFQKVEKVICERSV